MQRRKGLIIWLSVLSGLQSLASASAFGDVVGKSVSAFFLAVTAAMTMGTATYVAAMKGDITPEDSARTFARTLP